MRTLKKDVEAEIDDGAGKLAAAGDVIVQLFSGRRGRPRAFGPGLLLAVLHRRQRAVNRKDGKAPAVAACQSRVNAVHQGLPPRLRGQDPHAHMLILVQAEDLAVDGLMLLGKGDEGIGMAFWRNGLDNLQLHRTKLPFSNVCNRGAPHRAVVLIVRPRRTSATFLIRFDQKGSGKQPGRRFSCMCPLFLR